MLVCPIGSGFWSISAFNFWNRDVPPVVICLRSQGLRERESQDWIQAVWLQCACHWESLPLPWFNILPQDLLVHLQEQCPEAQHLCVAVVLQRAGLPVPPFFPSLGSTITWVCSYLPEPSISPRVDLVSHSEHMFPHWSQNALTQAKCACL